jgi:protein TonB
VAASAQLSAADPITPAQRVEPPSGGGGYLNNPPPPYPPISRRLGEQGEVVLRAFIEADGTASRVELLRSSGFDRLDRAALTAAKDWRYRPGTRAGRPEAMWFKLPVVFELQ